MENIKTKRLPLSPADEQSLRDAHLAGLVLLGLILFIFEAFIPKPLPWLKLGLANIVTLIALYWYGGYAALLVSLTRILLGALFTGSLLTPGFFLSLGGGFCAVLVMILLFRLSLFGIWGISLAGAASHGIGQIGVSYFLLFRNPVVWHLLPYLILYALASGTVIGFAVYFLLKRLKKEFAF